MCRITNKPPVDLDTSMKTRRENLFFGFHKYISKQRNSLFSFKYIISYDCKMFELQMIHGEKGLSCKIFENYISHAEFHIPNYWF